MTSEELTDLTAADRWREVCAQLRATDDISFKLLGFVPLFTVAAIGAVLFKADHRLSLGLILGFFRRLDHYAWFLDLGTPQHSNVQVAS